MLPVPAWLVDLALQGATAVAQALQVEQARKRANLTELATWDHPHYGRPCVVCGEPEPAPGAVCPGPPATQAARRRLNRS